MTTLGKDGLDDDVQQLILSGVKVKPTHGGLVDILKLIYSFV